MRLTHQIFLATVTSLLLAGSVQAAPDSEELVGTWYSERQQDGETMKWLTRRMDNQQYAALFLVCNGEDLSWVQKETGEWQFNNGELVETMMSMEDMNGKKQAPQGEGVDTTYVDLSIKGEALHYQKKDSDTAFDFDRVADGFQISCQ
jgi:hypothetical protein